MNIFRAILKDFKIYFNVKTKYGRKHSIALGSIVVAGLIVWGYLSGSKSATEEVAAPLPQVTVLSVAELASDARFDTIGKVEAVSEANLQTETGGRITSVTVKIGDRVSAGQVLATLENSAQRAALVQAQGAYEAAQAGAAQSTLSIGEAGVSISAAQNTLISSMRAGYNNSNTTILSSIDQFFSNPDSFVPGLKINSKGQANEFNKMRLEFRDILPAWSTRINALNSGSSLSEESAYAKQNINKTILFCDMFIALFANHDGSDAYSEADLKAYVQNFSSLKAGLIQNIAAIENAETQLKNAQNAEVRANSSATGGAASAADAQIKIALGSLQAAQSNYQKTVVRTPISGVVNALYLKAGDYATPGKPAGIIANNNGLQIKTFINEADSANLNVGDAVTIEGTSAGVITAKAAALDPSNGKIAVVIGVNPDSTLTNGATVKVSFAQISVTNQTEKILIPLSALKITSDGSFVFTLEADNKLKAVTVTQGQLFGENVEILTGITKDSRIVTDARGLKDGQLVTLSK